MFGIQKVEDVGIIFLTEIFINNNMVIDEWSTKFSGFVIKDTDSGLHNFDWCKIIRLYSGSDAHSLELFRELITRFNEGKSEFST